MDWVEVNGAGLRYELSGIGVLFTAQRPGYVKRLAVEAGFPTAAH